MPLARWPFAVLPALVLAALWLLDAHAPGGWPDAASPWFAQLRAVWPSSAALDRLDAAVVPDIPVATSLVLLVTVLCTLATMLAIGVPAGLAVAVALGLAATRTLWSTVAPGQDAVPVGLVAAAVCARAVPLQSGRLAWVVAGLAIVLSPPATWLVLPALGASRRRLVGAVGLVGLAAAVQLYALRVAWTEVACLLPTEWRTAMAEVLRPGTSADVSAWLAVRQAIAVLTGDVHLFGIAVAAFGLAGIPPRLRALRAASFFALVLAVVLVGTGLLPPAWAAALLLPWWAPWFALGLGALVDLAGGRSRKLAMTFAVVTAALLPPLRHAIVAPGPWKSGMPATAAAAASTWRGGAVAVEDAGAARRLRLAGVATVPADPRTLASCVASGREVFALGAMIRRVQQLGYQVAERPVRPPLAAILADVREGHLVALAIAPAGRVWAGPAGLSSLGRFGVTRDIPARVAVAALARADTGADVRTGRTGVDVTWREGDVVAGRPLLAPVSASAHEEAVAVDSAPLRLASGRVAALAVFDRAQDAVLKGVAEASPGLPVALARHAEWRNVAVRGRAQCVPASPAWTALPASMSRLALPVAGAAPGHPAIVLVGTDTPPQVTVDGLTIDPMWDASPVTVYDRDSASDRVRLQDALRQDAVPAGHVLAGRWAARVELRPRGVWAAPVALVSPGAAPAGWLVRLSKKASRAANTEVCAVVAGERALFGQDAPVDEDTPREVPLTIRDGWHAPERQRRAVHRWSARPTATMAFHLDTPLALVLAMDASGAATPDGRQPLAVRVNGQRLTADWPGDARLSVPLHFTRAGENTLELSVGTVVRPPGDSRPLGVLLRRVRLLKGEGS